MLVLEQHHGLARGAQGEGGVLGRVDDANGIVENGTCSGGSNMPSFMRAVKRRLRETSSWASVRRPLWTASVRARYVGAAVGVGSGEDAGG